MTPFHTRVHLSVTAVLAALLFEPIFGQVPAQFRAGTDLVWVDVAVLSDERQPVKNLTAADFAVFEDGAPRQIEAFASIDLPPSDSPKGAAWTSVVPSDVATNEDSSEPGRLVVILFDRSIPAGAATVAAKRIAESAVDQMGPTDLAAIVSTAGGRPQNLTADRARLRRAIDRPDWSAEVSEESEEIEQRLFEESGIQGRLPADGRCLCGACTLDAITAVARSLEGVFSRRKLLLFVGSSIQLQTSDGLDGCNFLTRDARQRMFSALDAANVTVHALDPAGLATRGRDAASRAAAARGLVIDRVLGASAPITEQAEQDSLRVLPERTGGRTVVNTNAPHELVPALFSESASYYVLGFRPAELEDRGGARRIDVHVNRQNVRAQFRKEYRLNATAPLLEDPEPSVLGGLLPADSVRLRSTASVLAAPTTARGAVVVSADLGAFAPLLGQSPVSLTLVVGAYDAWGELRASVRQAVRLTPPSSPLASFATSLRLDLDPGDYELRLGVSGDRSERPASVFSHVTVPNFSAQPLSLSTLIIGDVPTDPHSMDAGSASLQLPLRPTMQRRFTGESPIPIFTRIYQGPGRADPLRHVTLHGRVLNALGQETVARQHELAPSDFDNDRSADFLDALDVSTLSPGEYLYSLQATAGSLAAGRVVRFVVE